MKIYSIKKIGVVIFILALIAPTAFLAVPQRTHAFGIDAVVMVANSSVTGLYNLVRNTITAVSTVTTAVATVANEVNQYVLQPLAFVLSGEILKSMTASILNFITGKTNGTGIPQFIQNLQGYLQGTGNTQALAFSSQFGKYSNSPYATQIEIGRASCRERV